MFETYGIVGKGEKEMDRERERSWGGGGGDQMGLGGMVYGLRAQRKAKKKDQFQIFLSSLPEILT